MTTPDLDTENKIVAARRFPLTVTEACLLVACLHRQGPDAGDLSKQRLADVVRADTGDTGTIAFGTTSLAVADLTADLDKIDQQTDSALRALLATWIATFRGQVDVLMPGTIAAHTLAGVGLWICHPLLATATRCSDIATPVPGLRGGSVTLIQWAERVRQLGGDGPILLTAVDAEFDPVTTPYPVPPRLRLTRRVPASSPYLPLHADDVSPMSRAGIEQSATYISQVAWTLVTDTWEIASLDNQQQPPWMNPGPGAA